MRTPEKDQQPPTPHTCWDGIAHLCTACVEQGWEDGYEAAKEQFAPRTATIPVPYEGTQSLILDPATQETTIEWALETLNRLRDDSHDYDGEVTRILTAAVILYHAKAGTIAECLDTAIVWERG